MKNSVPPPDSFFFHGDGKTILFTLLSRWKSDELLTFTCNVNHCEFSRLSPCFPSRNDAWESSRHFRRGFWRGCKRDDLSREFSLLRGRRARFLNLSFAYREDERENGVDGIQKEMGQSDAAQTLLLLEGKEAASAARRMRTDVWCEFIAKTGFLAAARVNNNKQIANNRKLSFPQTPGLRWCAIKLRMH